MNKTFHTVWNEALGAWVAIPETQPARGKRSGSVLKPPALAGVAAALVVLGGWPGGALASRLDVDSTCNSGAGNAQLDGRSSARPPMGRPEAARRRRMDLAPIRSWRDAMPQALWPRR